MCPNEIKLIYYKVVNSDCKSFFFFSFFCQCIIICASEQWKTEVRDKNTFSGQNRCGIELENTLKASAKTNLPAVKKYIYFRKKRSPC